MNEKIIARTNIKKNSKNKRTEEKKDKNMRHVNKLWQFKVSQFKVRNFLFQFSRFFSIFCFFSFIIICFYNCFFDGISESSDEQTPLSSNSSHPKSYTRWSSDQLVHLFDHASITPKYGDLLLLLLIELALLLLSRISSNLFVFF